MGVFYLSRSALDNILFKYITRVNCRDNII